MRFNGEGIRATNRLKVFQMRKDTNGEHKLMSDCLNDAYCTSEVASEPPVFPLSPKKKIVQQSPVIVLQLAMLDRNSLLSLSSLACLELLENYLTLIMSLSSTPEQHASIK